MSIVNTESQNGASLLFDRQVSRMFHASRYAERICRAEPALLDDLAAYFQEALSITSLNSRLGGALERVDGTDEINFHAALRRLRRQTMLRIIFRDINGLADFAEVAATVSALADVTVNAAVRFHARGVARLFGLPESVLNDANAQMLVVGMGKLGAYELNVSSDIDLIFIYDQDGEAVMAGAAGSAGSNGATGEIALQERSWHEFHAETGKRVIRALDQIDENGFVFRVDMRLRPFGTSGPLVSSLATLAQYFRTQGRPWERYAWLKARALTGTAATKHALEKMVTSFVYRRYNDYGAIDEMRDLHGQIRAEATKKNRLNDIKVGRGGIREVEFIAQLFQLVRGGRDPALQVASTREALKLIAERGLVSPDKITRLQTAYLFLRNLEHRLQYLDDAQTQALPTNAMDQERIAAAMNVESWAEFEAALNLERNFVNAEFESLFAAVNSAKTLGTTNSLPAAKVPSIGLEASIHAVFQLACSETSIDPAIENRMVTRIKTWQKSSRTQTLSPKIVARMEALIPAALKASLAFEKPAETFFRLLDLLDAIDKRETYLALLMEYPAVLPRVARIAASSGWAADFLKRHPILLDELITVETGSPQFNWPAERAKLQRACDQAAGDVEKLYELLRHTKQSITIKLNIADIEGRIGVMALSDALSALADMLLDTTLVLVQRTLTKTDNGWQAPPGFAIIGYGKLGSKELGYASDLDLVFIFDENIERRRGDAVGSGNGESHIIGGEQYSKLAQRLRSWLNTATVGGDLYETDLRLRPDGDSGMLVSDLSAFRDYQLSRAWTWEHQALTRARWCAGDASLALPFDAIRHEVLSAPRNEPATRQKLRTEILEMRDKMRAEKKDRTDTESPALDLKHTRGGIVDVEFIVQYLILAYSHEHAEFLGNLGNFALLMRSGALGILDEDIAAKVAKAYLAYRERQHRARNNNQLKTWVGLDEFVEERRAVVAAWGALFG